MRKSGVDDEVIQSGENLLLTFTKVRNEAGRGNDIFNQATAATLNLSVAMGTDMSSSAILVGKALQDPIRGSIALTRAGVQLTESQRETIKTMVASGDTMGAQKVILKELETQFGGSAEAAGKTFGGQIDIAKQTVSNMAGEIVGKMIPSLLQFVTFVSGSVLPWIQGFIDKIRGGGAGGDSLQGSFAGVRAFIADVWWPTMKQIFELVASTFSAMVAVFRSHEPEIRTIVTGIGQVLRGVAIVLQEVLLPILRLAFVEVLPRVIGVAIASIATFTSAISGIAAFVAGAREKLAVFWEWLRTQALTTAASVVEPFSRLPGAMGGWARDAKNAINAELAKIETQKEIRISAKIFASLSQGAQNAPDNRGDPRDPNQLAATSNRLIDSYISGRMGDIVKSLPRTSSVGAVAGLTGGDSTINQSLWDELASARRYGLQLTSGHRPGAITRSGTPSDHGTFPSKAIDVSNGYNTPQMAAFFMSLIGNRGVKQAFYDPLGSIFGGVLSSYREGGHTNHVHVATYDQGGLLPPGLTLARNLTGRDELILSPEQTRAAFGGRAGAGGGDLHVHVSGNTILGDDQRLAERLAKQLAQPMQAELSRLISYRNDRA